MNANKPASRRSLKSDLGRVDAHKVRPEEYEELPQLGHAARAAILEQGFPAWG
jgi:hypothetical protein